MEAGTVLPYVRRSQALGFEVIITNTNDNYREGIKILGSESAEQHAEAVWKNVVQPANVKSIALLAHGYGGKVVNGLSKKFKNDFEKKVFAVALIDSDLTSSIFCSRPTLRLIEVGTNFVSSEKQQSGTYEESYVDEISRFSLGHKEHAIAPYTCTDELFNFLRRRYKKERNDEITKNAL